jgi:uncharacterized protein
MAELSSEARNLNWLVQNFADRVPGVTEAVVVSSDGLPIATSTGLDRDAADRFAAVASGLIGLAYGAAGRFGGGAVNEVIIEMENAFLFVTGISDGSCLACTASAECDVGLVGYEMAVLVDKAGAVLTPEIRAELQSVLPRWASTTTTAVRASESVRTYSRRAARARTPISRSKPWSR